MIYYKRRDASAQTAIIIYVSCALLLIAVAYNVLLLLKLSTNVVAYLLAASIATYHIAIVAISILALYSTATRSNCVKYTMAIQLVVYLIACLILIAYLGFYIYTLYCTVYVAELCLQVRKFMTHTIAVILFSMLANCEITLISVFYV